MRCCCGEHVTNVIQFYLADKPQPTESVKRIVYADDIPVWDSEVKYSSIAQLVGRWTLTSSLTAGKK